MVILYVCSSGPYHRISTHVGSNRCAGTRIRGHCWKRPKLINNGLHALPAARIFLARCEEGRVCTKHHLCPKCLRYGVWMHCGVYLIVPFLRSPRINSRRYLIIESGLVGLVGHWQCHHKGLCMLTFWIMCPECWFLSCVQWLTKIIIFATQTIFSQTSQKPPSRFVRTTLGFIPCASNELSHSMFKRLPAEKIA